MTVLLFAACSSSSTSPVAVRRRRRVRAAQRPGRQRGAVGQRGRRRRRRSLSRSPGTAVLSGWRSSPEEGEALTQTLLGFPAVYPERPGRLPADRRRLPDRDDHQDQQPTRSRTSSTSTPSTRPSGSTRASSSRSTTTSPRRASTPASSSTATPSIFKGKDGKIYGFPKDGNTIAMAYNSGPRHRRRRRRWTSWSRPPRRSRARADLKAPLCLNPGLDRGLAFLYAQGGCAAHRRRHGPSAIDTDASKAAVQWYLDLFKNGLGMTAADLGAGWCGEALGKKQVAIIFEGGWLDPCDDRHLSRTSSTPGREMPTGSSGKPGDDLVHGQLLDRCGLGQQGPGVRAAQLPDRQRTA